MGQIGLLIGVALTMFTVFGLITLLSHIYTLNIKSKTVGDGQHGTARWIRPDEIAKVYKRVPFTPELWRQGKNLPQDQGIVVGCETARKTNETTALVDTGDVHGMMIGAAGVGKTAYWLYPCIEYACASGMSFLTTDTKGDLCRNYGRIAQEDYGYHVSVIDLRNPTRSDGANLLTLVNKYMDLYMAEPDKLAFKAKAEKYAKIIAKTIILAGSDGDFGQNSFFYDSAEGLICSAILLVAEFCSPAERHIVSVFKIIQELLEPSRTPVQKNQFQILLEKLPENHRAKWYAGAALSSGEQAMASVMSTALARLNVFLDSELEQILCFDTNVDAEVFCKEKSAMFIIMPEEDNSKYFMVSLLIQQLYREMLAVADEHGGKLDNRVAMYCDEFGTLPKIESAELMFSAGRSRRISMMPIIQSHAQLERNYGQEGAKIILDNVQLTIFGGFGPSSDAPEILSKALGNRTVQTGSISRGKNDPSQSLQMTERPLLSPDELRCLPKGEFIVMKTGVHPMRTRLKLFFEWGIQFHKEYVPTEHANRAVAYADAKRLRRAIDNKYPSRHFAGVEPEARLNAKLAFERSRNHGEV